MSKTDFDIEAAHNYFSAECFNRAWDFIDKKERTASEETTMLALSLASLWHWTQRDDCTSENMSVAYWQVSRVFALLHQPANARNYGEMCLEVSKDSALPPYCLAYAYEAMARAEKLAGHLKETEEFLQKSREVVERMTDPETKKQVLADLGTIK